MSYLITGSTGFVGKHLIEKLKSKGSDVFALYRNNLNSKVDGVLYKQIDLNNVESLKKYLNEIKPKNIIHLAADSSVAFSWEYPIKSFNNNMNIYLNLIDAVRQSSINPTILSIGSSEVYGKVKKGCIPIKESNKLNPTNPYSVARVSQELISDLYLKAYGLSIIKTRSFNHLGVGQDSRFFIPSVIKQLLDIKSPNLKLGNLDIIRDFLDVEDVVDAYFDLIQHGISGEVYNVCSGLGYSLNEIVKKVMYLTKIKKPIILSQAKLRPIDNPIIVGDNSKLKLLNNWKPKNDIDISIKKMLEFEKASHFI